MGIGRGEEGRRGCGWMEGRVWGGSVRLTDMDTNVIAN